MIITKGKKRGIPSVCGNQRRHFLIVQVYFPKVFILIFGTIWQSLIRTVTKSRDTVLLKTGLLLISCKLLLNDC